MRKYTGVSRYIYIYIYIPGHVDFSKFQNRNRSFLAHFYIYTGKYHDFGTDSDTDLRIYIYTGLYIYRETPVYEDSYWETFLRGGINHAQSTGNHTERLWKKSRPKIRSDANVRAIFREIKSPLPLLSMILLRIPRIINDFVKDIIIYLTFWL